MLEDHFETIVIWTMFFLVGSVIVIGLGVESLLEHIKSQLDDILKFLKELK